MPWSGMVSSWFIPEPRSVVAHLFGIALPLSIDWFNITSFMVSSPCLIERYSGGSLTVPWWTTHSHTLNSQRDEVLVDSLVDSPSSMGYVGASRKSPNEALWEALSQRPNRPISA